MNTLLQEYHDRLGAALEGDNRLAAIEQLHAEMEARIAALEPQPCVGCGRKPEESWREEWQPCDRCGKPICDTCYYDDYNGEGHYCSLPCANYNNPDRPLE